MKYIISLILLYSFNSYALNVCNISLPKDCEKIVDSEFSSGGSKTTMWLLEVGCTNKKGNYIKYITSRFAVSGMLGSFIGRWNAPDKLIFEKKDIKKMKFKCK